MKQQREPEALPENSIPMAMLNMGAKLDKILNVSSHTH